MDDELRGTRTRITSADASKLQRSLTPAYRVAIHESLVTSLWPYVKLLAETGGFEPPEVF